MLLKEYYSDNIRDISSMSTSFAGEYFGMYHYAIDNQDIAEKLHDYIKEELEPAYGLCVDTGFVCDFEKNDEKYYLIQQSLYNASEIGSLHTTLSLLSDYIAYLDNKGVKDCLVVDCYGEAGDNLYSFDIAFLLPKTFIEHED